MFPYRFRFHRYDSKKGQSRISGWTSVSAASFDKAVDVASAMLNGMQGADPDREYKLIAVEQDGIHTRETGMSYKTALRAKGIRPLPANASLRSSITLPRDHEDRPITTICATTSALKEMAQ